MSNDVIITPPDKKTQQEADLDPYSSFETNKIFAGMPLNSVEHVEVFIKRLMDPVNPLTSDQLKQVLVAILCTMAPSLNEKYRPAGMMYKGQQTSESKTSTVINAGNTQVVIDEPSDDAPQPNEPQVPTNESQTPGPVGMWPGLPVVK